MNDLFDGACPACRSERVAVMATVSVFRYERSFHQCDDCGLTFAGSWSDIHGESAAPQVQLRVDGGVELTGA